MPNKITRASATEMTLTVRLRSAIMLAMYILGCVPIFMIASPAHPAVSATQTALLCDLAAQSAARSQNVPYDVLRAISRVETGRSLGDSLHPWPWTVNMEGAGKWFASEDDARAYVFKHFKRGARSFDVGCFQINYKWHGAAFRSIDDMFDPNLNADYAAGFLRDLYEELGDWTAAVGAYHSRTPTYADSYSARYKDIHSTMRLNPGDLPLPDAHSDQSGGSGLFSARLRAPLIVNGTARMGSLVPMGQSNQAFVVMN